MGLKEEHSQATRAALIKAARRLFTRHGYGGTATEEIVRRAGVTRGALYHHFKDKEDLFLAVHTEVDAELATRIEAAAASADADPMEGLRVAAEAFLDSATDPAIRQITLLDAPSVLGWEAWREIDNRHSLGFLKSQLEEAMRSGAIPPEPLEPLAHLLLGAIAEAGLVVAHADDVEAASREMKATVSRFLARLAAPAAAA